MEEGIKKRLVDFLSPRGLASRIAKDAEIPYNTVVNWRNGRSIPSLPEAYKLCKTMGWSLEWLITGKEAIELDEIEKQIINIVRENEESMESDFLTVVQTFSITYGKPKRGNGYGTQAG